MQSDARFRRWTRRTDDQRHRLHALTAQQIQPLPSLRIPVEQDTDSSQAIGVKTDGDIICGFRKLWFRAARLSPQPFLHYG
ncbi:MAG: hypothetical protein IPL59_09530 [Candidatus Competibacteraceae bacterium]|nr:hypothetical protein [Candidatus Competibacteraceae bacterium]